MVRQSVVQGRQSKMMVIDIDVVFLLNFASLNKIALSSPPPSPLGEFGFFNPAVHRYRFGLGVIGREEWGDRLRPRPLTECKARFFSFGLVFASAAFELSP